MSENRGAVEPQINLSMLRMLLAAGSSVGMPRAELLGVVGLTENELLDPDGTIAISRQIALGRHIVAARPGVSLGLKALENFSPAHLGVLGYSLRHCATLGDALDTFIRYQTLVTDAAQWRRSGSRIHIGVYPALKMFLHPVEHMIGMWIVLGRKLTGQHWLPRSVSFQHQPTGPLSLYRTIMGVEPLFGAAQDELDLGSAVLSLPVQGAQIAVLPGILTLLDSRLPVQTGGSFRQEVVGVLREQLPRGRGSREDTAESLGVSPRTLARRLKEEGCSFKEVLDEIRCELAQHWLKNPSLAIYEVAFLLGYSEPSTFHRAFRRWTRETPAAWRAGLRSTGMA